MLRGLRLGIIPIKVVLGDRLGAECESARAGADPESGSIAQTADGFRGLLPRGRGHGLTEETAQELLALLRVGAVVYNLRPRRGEILELITEGEKGPRVLAPFLGN